MLTAVTIAVTTVALGISGSLMLFSDYLHRASMSLANSVESLGLVDEAEVDLLLHDRAASPIARHEIEDSLRRRLAAARRYIVSPEEARTLRVAGQAVDKYFDHTRDPSATSAGTSLLLNGAYDSLERLVDMNVASARRARDSATRWEAVANRIGITIGITLLLLSSWLLWWLRSRAFRPVLALASSIERFARGDREARAAEVGPGELREMARRFNQMADALATQRQDQLAFLGGVAHDLKNPLSALRLSVALIAPGQPLPAEPKIRRTMDLVERQIAQMERMVGDLLDMARIESGQLELQFQVRDAGALVREVVELFEATSPQHELAVQIPAGEILLKCDPVRMAQVLSNLISNAIKYSPGGTRIEVALARHAETLSLSVTDHGIGISDQDQRHMFEPFRRFTSTKGQIPGVGLGLFMVRQIVRAHGGHIDVQSQVSQGTSVRVHVPLDCTTPGAVDALPSNPIATVSGRPSAPSP